VGDVPASAAGVLPSGVPPGVAGSVPSADCAAVPSGHVAPAIPGQIGVKMMKELRGLRQIEYKSVLHCSDFDLRTARSTKRAVRVSCRRVPALSAICSGGPDGAGANPPIYFLLGIDNPATQLATQPDEAWSDSFTAILGERVRLEPQICRRLSFSQQRMGRGV